MARTSLYKTKLIERPSSGIELLEMIKANKPCEVVDSHAFIAAKVLEENLNQSFRFKLSDVNHGWTLFLTDSM